MIISDEEVTKISYIGSMAQGPNGGLTHPMTSSHTTDCDEITACSLVGIGTDLPLPPVEQLVYNPMDRSTFVAPTPSGPHSIILEFCNRVSVPRVLISDTDRVCVYPVSLVSR